MKTFRVSALITVIVLSLALLAGCKDRNQNNTSVPSEPSIVSSLPDVTEDLPSEIEDIPSEVDEFGSEVEGDISEALDGDMSEAFSDVESQLTMSTDFSQIGALNAEKKGWGSGGPTDDQLRPNGSTQYQKIYGDYGAFFIAPESKHVYLTFDEGYENGYTAAILDTLKDTGVKAVFFITYPYAKSEPDLVRRMIDEGHILGNHSTKHLSFPDMPLKEAAEDIANLHDYVLENYGYKMELFRFPMGEFSEQTLALAQSLGYKSVFWSFAYKDYLVDAQPDTATALKNATEKVHPGAIYLLHAVSKTNAEILEDLIETVRIKGYTWGEFDLQ